MLAPLALILYSGFSQTQRWGPPLSQSPQHQCLYTFLLTWIPPWGAQVSKLLFCNFNIRQYLHKIPNTIIPLISFNSLLFWMYYFSHHQNWILWTSNPQKILPNLLLNSTASTGKKYSNTKLSRQVLKNHKTKFSFLTYFKVCHKRYKLIQIHNHSKSFDGLKPSWWVCQLWIIEYEWIVNWN